MFNIKIEEVLTSEEIKSINKEEIREFVNLAEEQIFLSIKESPSIKKFTRGEIEIIFKLANADLEAVGYYSTITGISIEKQNWMQEVDIKKFDKPMLYYYKDEMLYSEEYIANTPLDELKEKFNERKGCK